MSEVIDLTGTKDYWDFCVNEVDNRISNCLVKMMGIKDIAFDVSILLNVDRKYTKKDLLIGISDTTLLINPIRMYEEIQPNELAFVLRHEAWHLIGFDTLRMKGKDPVLWNYACDYYINYMLVNDRAFKEFKPPSGLVIDSMFKSYSKEEIYEYLVSNSGESADMPDHNSGFALYSDISQLYSEDDGGDGFQDQNLETLPKSYRELISQAVINAKLVGGAVPRHIEKYIDGYYHPQLDWHSILLNYMFSFETFDYSYQKVNMKFLAQDETDKSYEDIYLPTTYSESIDEICIAIDESGSVTDQEFAIFIGAVKKIFTRLKPKTMRIIKFSYDINEVCLVTSLADIEELSLRSSGGTYITAVFEYIEKEALKPDVFILMSDMYCRIPEPPNLNMVWLVINNPNFQLSKRDSRRSRIIHVPTGKGANF